MAFAAPRDGETPASARANPAQMESKELFSVRASARDGVNHPLTAIPFDKGERETHVETT